MCSFRKLKYSILPLLFISAPILADTIEFPEEELATETVLPVFENAKGVLNRKIKTAGRFELGGGAGLALNEPFYNPINMNLQGTYHFNELHAVNIMAYFFMDGLSSYGEQLKNAENLGDPFDASEAPVPGNLIIGSYQVQAFYGKISLTKKSVMNLALVGVLGAGMLGYDSGDSVPALNFGFGQKFYFNERIALRFDFRVLAYQGPDPTSLNLDPEDSFQPDPGAFDNEIFFNTYLTSSLVFLL